MTPKTDKRAESRPAAPKKENPALMTVAVSSRALFDFEEENAIFERRNESEYMETQRKRLSKVAAPGVAFPMVKKLLALNGAAKDERLVDVIVLSRNDPTTGLRVFRSIGEKALDIRRGCFTRGAPALPYLSAFGVDLFLSAHRDDVRHALENNFAAARVMDKSAGKGETDDILRIAFDGDAVLFGDEAERTYQKGGLSAFMEQEKSMSSRPLSAGPIKPFFDALWKLRQKVPNGKIRTALITSRGAPAHERPIQTLMKWKVEVDEAYFLSGRRKEEIIKSFRPDFFFDDQTAHLQNIKAAGHVPFGIVNEAGAKNPPPPARRPAKR